MILNVAGDRLAAALKRLGVDRAAIEGFTPALVLEWGETLLLVVVTLVAGRLAIRFSHLVIRRMLDVTDGGRVRVLSEQRATTLSGLLINVASYVINFIVILTVLQIFGIPTEHVLAGAGIIGLAVGFGAQNLVKDIITGFFILYEDQFGVGDVVSLADVQGTVEEMGLRVTKIRDFDGSLHIIPNSDIRQVNNRSRGTSRIMLDVAIAYEDDVDRAIEVLEDLCSEFTDEVLVEGPKVLGVQALGDSSVTIRLLARTRALEHWAVERRLRLAAKKLLDEAGIEIPYPRLVMVPAQATKIGQTLEALRRGPLGDTASGDGLPAEVPGM